MEFKFQFKQQQKQEVKQEQAVAVAVQAEEQADTSQLLHVVILECGIIAIDEGSLPFIPIGTELVLEREPSNEIDRWAIKVKTQEESLLGYLPQKKNQSLARLMDAGRKVRVFVTDANTEEFKRSLQVFRNGESRKIPLRIEMEIPERKDEENE